MSVHSLDSNSVNKIAVDNKPKVKSPSADQLKGPSFKDTLESQVNSMDSVKETKAPLPKTLEFSNHAVDRMSKRGISFTADQMTKIEGAVRKAAEKGAKEALVFADDAALIVSLKDNKVVTVMDKESLKDNVFTKIDSTIVV
jgi:flagellar operon protein